LTVRHGEPDLDAWASIFLLHDSGIPKDPELSRDSLLVGTPMYMSPEQTLGPQVDRRSDIYSLGCTLHYVLAGRPVYPRDTIGKVLLAHRRGHLPSLRKANPAVPAAVDELFQRMAARLPDERYQSAAGLITDLERVIATLRQVPS